MKRVLLFLIFFLIGLVSFTAYSLLRKNPGKPVNNIVETVVTPPFSIENPPSESVKGTITGMSGEVLWQSRTASEASRITSPQAIQQGETIQTGDTGNLTVNFPNEAEIKALSQTQIDLVQTLPVNFVASIASGSAQFTKTGSAPITIRALHLLIKIVQGTLSLGVDEKNSLVNFSVINGSIQVAFNNLDLVSNVITFDQNQRHTFNDLTRSFE